MYAWEAGPALVQTVDFFTPIVDDPYIYGRIAAANSLSDVYAMGGRPLTALAIAGFPQKGLDTDTIAAIFRGGYDVLREAGVALLGGHTVQDAEIKFGYAVTGAVDPARIWTNAGARAGDVLVLTKAHRHRRDWHRDQVRPRAGRRRRDRRGLDDSPQPRRGRRSPRRRRRPRVHGHHRFRAGRPRLRDGRGQRRADRAPGADGCRSCPGHETC